MSKVVKLTSALEQTRGVIGRYPEPDVEYHFLFGRVAPRPIHMVGVRKPLRVEWYVGETLRATKTLRPWVGIGCHEADRVVEKQPASTCRNLG